MLKPQLPPRYLGMMLGSDFLRNVVGVTEKKKKDMDLFTTGVGIIFF